MKYVPIIGLEIHIELGTKSKMFCSCAADHFGKEPNTLTCPVCLGLPGALPVPNKKAIDWTIKLGQALNCKIAPESKFDRKNYFYPDLPKGYQISQYDMPVATHGEIYLRSDLKYGKSRTLNTRINRVHLEEDTGKLQHAKVKGKDVSLVDFNRSGVPLVEIVTEPDIRSSEDAVVFMKKLRQIVRYLEISDADMEKGSMRIEPNISVYENKRTKVTFPITNYQLPDYKVEVKNINSFNFAKRAIDYEIERHIKLLKHGIVPKQETRGWNEKKNITVSQRSKEEAHDYRYFPEPDIPPTRFSQSYLRRLKANLPEMPDSKAHRFINDYKLSQYDAELLTVNRDLADWFEEAVKAYTQTAHPGIKEKSKLKTKSSAYAKVIANWIMGDMAG